ncbi:hypothetical protein BDV38DRAFT_237496 [Aspergillus pseudotamarii]|uniref:Uncharacterized protein n=1 Tax=Aspergillus pseudotamarii TaxID=132259 RepID=A0A5N6T4H6_ASPPS|nr:uncharacterized protein BDV38DRAFT_237496 [Aspergillus pseudotamarii]KAE8141202.1 hypothetical protein BDV38DRAFT_237496 [Aspergillus pseudotamarii]
MRGTRFVEGETPAPIPYVAQHSIRSHALGFRTNDSTALSCCSPNDRLSGWRKVWINRVWIMSALCRLSFHARLFALDFKPAFFSSLLYYFCCALSRFCPVFGIFFNPV